MLFFCFFWGGCCCCGFLFGFCCCCCCCFCCLFCFVLFVLFVFVLFLISHLLELTLALFYFRVIECVYVYFRVNGKELIPFRQHYTLIDNFDVKCQNNGILRKYYVLYGRHYRFLIMKNVRAYPRWLFLLLF